ncbi:hypothetical protein C8Q74DRAFT_200382 [Fomes fomentarius]|nr:hypothetical protein C8Q74DRAFT_200382 [Fomes fomentarius]
MHTGRVKRPTRRDSPMMNGVAPPNPPPPQQPPQPQPASAPPAQANQGTSSRVSPALLHGAEKLSQLLDRRVNAVRAEYEEKLRVVTRERDALLSGNAIKPEAALYAELATHRAARETRAQEHAGWAEENKKLAEEIKRLAEERDSLARDRDDRSNRLYEAEKEATRLFSEIEVMRSENEKLKRALAAASHAQTQPMRASEQPPSSPLEFIHSPTARSSTLPTLADSSSTLSLSSTSSTPNPHPDPSFSQQPPSFAPNAASGLAGCRNG